MNNIAQHLLRLISCRNHVSTGTARHIKFRYLSSTVQTLFSIKQDVIGLNIVKLKPVFNNLNSYFLSFKIVSKSLHIYLFFLLIMCVCGGGAFLFIIFSSNVILLTIFHVGFFKDWVYLHRLNLFFTVGIFGFSLSPSCELVSVRNNTHKSKTHPNYFGVIWPSVVYAVVKKIVRISIMFSQSAPWEVNQVNQVTCWYPTNTR